jgi:hypothetical protein
MSHFIIKEVIHGFHSLWEILQLVIILFVILTNRGVPESLDPLSTIVQLYRGSQFCKVEVTEVSKENQQLSEGH